MKRSVSLALAATLLTTPALAAEDKKKEAEKRHASSYEANAVLVNSTKTGEPTVYAEGATLVEEKVTSNTKLNAEFEVDVTGDALDAIFGGDFDTMAAAATSAAKKANVKAKTTVTKNADKEQTVTDLGAGPVVSALELNKSNVIADFFTRDHIIVGKSPIAESKITKFESNGVISDDSAFGVILTPLERASGVYRNLGQGYQGFKYEPTKIDVKQSQSQKQEGGGSTTIDNSKNENKTFNTDIDIDQKGACKPVNNISFFGTSMTRKGYTYG